VHPCLFRCLSSSFYHEAEGQAPIYLLLSLKKVLGWLTRLVAVCVEYRQIHHYVKGSGYRNQQTITTHHSYWWWQYCVSSICLLCLKKHCLKLQGFVQESPRHPPHPQKPSNSYLPVFCALQGFNARVDNALAFNSCIILPSTITTLPVCTNPIMHKKKYLV